MARKKMTTYMEEDLLRSAKILAARSDSKIYEIFEEALRRYLNEVDTVEVPLAEALSAQQTGETLSGAIIAERASRY